MSMPKVMLIPHLNGEYLSVNISGLEMRTGDIRTVLDESFREIKKPSTTKLIGLHMYRTNMTDENMTLVKNWFEAIKGKARKVAVIGLSFFEKAKVKKITKGMDYITKYFSDIDQSKDWLMGK